MYLQARTFFTLTDITSIPMGAMYLHAGMFYSLPDVFFSQGCSVFILVRRFIHSLIPILEFSMVRSELWLLGGQYGRSFHEIIITLVKTCLISFKFNINHYWGYAALPVVPGSCLCNTGVTSTGACDWLSLWRGCDIRTTSSPLTVGSNFSLVHY